MGSIFLCTMEKRTSGNWWAATCVGRGGASAGLHHGPSPAHLANAHGALGARRVPGPSPDFLGLEKGERPPQGPRVRKGPGLLPGGRESPLKGGGGPAPLVTCSPQARRLCRAARRPHRLELPQEGMLQRPLPGWLGHVQVQAVPSAHGVQAEDEGHVVLQQAGICGAARAGEVGVRGSIWGKTVTHSTKDEDGRHRLALRQHPRGGTARP